MLIAEFFGTFILVFAGCGAIVANAAYAGALGHSGVALAWGAAPRAPRFIFEPITDESF